MAVHFASSHPVDFYKLAGNVNLTPPAGFNAAHVSQTLRCVASSANWRQTIPAAVRSDFYWQGRVKLGVTSSVAVPLVSFFSTVSSVMTERLRLQYVNFGSIRLMYNLAGTWTQIGSALAISASLYTITCRFKFGASGGDIAFYVNNALIGQVTGDTTAYNAAAFISDVELQNPSAGSGAYADIDWAEVVVTTDENPFAMAVKMHVITGEGATSDWIGPYTNIDDTDPSAADIIASAIDGDLSTYVIDDLPSIGTDVIRAVQVSVMARRGQTGPTQIQPALRASGVDQFGTAQTLATGYQTYRHIFDTNSVTGNEFTKTEIDGSQPGVKALA